MLKKIKDKNSCSDPIWDVAIRFPQSDHRISKFELHQRTILWRSPNFDFTTIRLRKTNRNVPYFVSPKSRTGVISSKIKHFQCHSLPDRVYSTHKFTMFHRGWPSDVSNGHRSSTVCLLKNKVKSQYLPLKYCSGWNYDRV